MEHYNMLSLRHKKGQAVFGEYVMLAVIVVATVTAMTIYVRRTLQGRIRDTIYSSAETLRTPYTLDGGVTFNQYRGTIYIQYEPYYGNRASIIDQQSETVKTISAGGTSGVYREEPNDRAIIQTISDQAPPKDAR